MLSGRSGVLSAAQRKPACMWSKIVHQVLLAAAACSKAKGEWGNEKQDNACQLAKIGP